MRALSVLLCAGLVALSAAQFGRFPFSFGGGRRPNSFRNNGFRPVQQQQFRPQQQQFRPQPQPQPQQRPQQQGGGGGGGLYYSWTEFGNRKFTWPEANRHCQSRGQQLVAVTNAGKNSQIVGEIERNNIAYIWTGGQRRGNGFVWPDGTAVTYNNWSFTGGRGTAQPDNREGDENCLAMLNRFYPGERGVFWHDVSCHHGKPFVCE